MKSYKQRKAARQRAKTRLETGAFVRKPSADTGYTKQQKKSSKPMWSILPCARSGGSVHRRRPSMPVFSFKDEEDD